MQELHAGFEGEVDRTARWRTILMVAIAIAVAAVLTAIVLTLGAANRERDRALARQSHSYEVMILTNSLSATLASAEASLGRFVISGDKNLGRRYMEQWRRASQQIDRLRRVTYDSPDQTRRIKALEAAYVTRGEELSSIALATNYGKNTQALAGYYEARDSASLKRLLALSDEITRAERALLAARTQRADATVKRSSSIAAVLAGIGLLLVIAAAVLGWWYLQALHERSLAAAEADAERARAIELEEAVAAATAELKSEAQERLAAEAQLRQVQKMEAVGQLTGGIAHDFNNMLAVVLGGIELARRSVGDDGFAARQLDHAMEGANRAAALTRRLLAFARAEALQPEAVEAAALIKGMSELLDRTLGDTIAVRTFDCGSGWRIWVDPHQLENAILNLAVNARDAMNGRGTLTIGTRAVTLAEGEIADAAGGDYVAISVTDDGCGIPPDMIERVFEPFFTTKPVGKGTGLGLSQIFGFVHQSDGTVAIESEVGRGTTVTLYLPRHAALPAACPVRPAASPAPVGEADLSLDILVVEDDPRVLRATMGALQELGHRAIACNDPLRAAEVIRSLDSLDLVLSDVMMPGQTGPEMIATLEEVIGDAGVLFVTGYAEANAVDTLHGYPVLRKPFTIAGLAAAIGRAHAARLAGRAERRAASG